MDGGGILKPTEDGREGTFDTPSVPAATDGLVDAVAVLNGGSAGAVVGNVNEIGLLSETD